MALVAPVSTFHRPAALRHPAFRTAAAHIVRSVKLSASAKPGVGDCSASSSRRADPAGAPNFSAASALLAVAACSSLLAPGLVQALELHAEPSNALSLPTWAIHVSSVLEWVTAMGLMWRYADVSGNPRWKGMTWAMLPCLGSAMAACTWHLFYNSPDLEFLVVVQSALTVVGNCTCCLAAYRLYTAAAAEKTSA